MKILWSPEAAADFAGIIDYIQQQNPSVADRVCRSLYDSINSLERLSNRGRPGRVDGTRELVVASLPYIVVYRVRQDGVEVVRVIHGAQRWP